ncbi:MAG: hypothetical protein KGQ83_09710 [Planctomycetes bacterium]|nr:hypothetical protein [Planctomycetota bacterium]
MYNKTNYRKSVFTYSTTKMLTKKEKIAQLIICFAMSDVVMNTDSHYEIYCAFLNAQDKEDVADHFSFVNVNGDLDEVLMVQEFDEYFIDQVLEVINNKIVKINQFIQDIKSL